MQDVNAFLNTKSRCLKITNLPLNPQAFLSEVFQTTRPSPKSLWVSRNDILQQEVYAVFDDHQSACALLAQSSGPISLVPALESDLEPFHKLVRLQLCSPSRLHRPPMLQLSTDPSDFNLDRPISSNPPNPRTNFRLGDWICSSPKCGAHNFGRNLACIGCGCSRANKPAMPPSNRPSPSPRFANSPNSQVAFSPKSPYPSTPQSPYSVTQAEAAATAIAAAPSLLYSSKSGHPLLTPSGRAFAVGGRVRNISSDPLTPCIMYWPDNEPLPEQGQIRPGGLVGMPHPPILNTGNRGPIAHQPGDWICQKCNYLNWRRRKVCQICLPYAEGNGDSISAAVQAERIALLTSVLAQTQISATSPNPSLRSQVMRSHSVTPPQVHRAFTDVSPPQSRGPVHRSQSQLELGAQYLQNSRPIYQTSGHREPSPVYSNPSPLQQHFISQVEQLTRVPVYAPAPAPLLPSFLQDIVHSPALSPSSTSSADLSLEEYDTTSSSPSQISSSRSRQTSGDSSNLNFDNIWRLDGEESKCLSGFRLPSSVSNSRKSSLEKLRC